MTVPVEALQPAEEAKKVEKPEELEMVQPSDHEMQLFQQAFEHNAISVEQGNLSSLQQMDRMMATHETNFVTNRLSTVAKMMDRDDD